MFIKQVHEQLAKMSSKEKEDWILRQALLISERRQKDFLMSLSNEKKVIYMPTQKEIDEFCEKVEDEEIYLTYETHYYEFDEDGHYMDDYRIWYHDPFYATNFLDCIFQGCEDLMKLEEYGIVVDIFNKINKLKFKINEDEDSEDCPADDYFTLYDIDREGLFNTSLKDVASVWVKAIVRSKKQWHIHELADILVAVFQNPICYDINPHVLKNEYLSKEVYSFMIDDLKQEILKDEEVLNTKYLNDSSLKKYEFIKKQDRKKEIVNDLLELV